MVFRKRTGLANRQAWICVLLAVVCNNVEAQTTEPTRDVCVCVEYYQCNQNGTVKSDGGDILIKKQGSVTTFRFGGKRECPGVQVCCIVPPELMYLLSPNETAPGVTTPTPPVVTPQVGCGARRNLSSSPSPNGVSTETNHFTEFPWTMKLLVKPEGSDNVQLKCGGSLIHPQYVVTAAHCVEGVDRNTMTVRGGEWNPQSQNKLLPHQDRSIKEIIIHPNYKSSNLHNDIALLIVDSPFTLAEHVNIVCLSGFSITYDEARCVATGWGIDPSITNKTQQDFLRKVDAKIVSKVSCQDQLRKTYLGRFFILNDSFMCAKGEGSQDTCQGDGGGPLICPHPVLPNSWVQVGIVSWGVTCTTEHPAVYTRLLHFHDWIVTQLPSTGSLDDL